MTDKKHVTVRAEQLTFTQVTFEQARGREYQNRTKNGMPSWALDNPASHYSPECPYCMITLGEYTAITWARKAVQTILVYRPYHWVDTSKNGLEPVFMTDTLLKALTYPKDNLSLQEFREKLMQMDGPDLQELLLILTREAEEQGLLDHVKYISTRNEDLWAYNQRYIEMMKRYVLK